MIAAAIATGIQGWGLLALVWGAAIAAALAVTGFVAAGGLGDIPDARSSHSRTTPTAGGLGVLAGLGAGLWAAAAVIAPSPALAGSLALVFAVAVVGLFDDAFGLRARTKMGLLLGLATVATWHLEPVTRLPMLLGTVDLPWGVGFAGTVFWIVGITNAVNFMDGINGMLAGTLNAVLMAFAAIASVFGGSDALWLAVALSGGLVGFMPYNWRRRAGVFAGDVGALPLGFAVALLPLLTELRGPMLYLVPLLLLPFLIDVVSTLITRLRRGENLAHAHREHIYQHLSARWGHPATSTVYTLSVLPLAGLAIVALVTKRVDALEVVVGLGVLGVGLAAWVRPRIRSGVPPRSRQDLPEPSATGTSQTR